MTHATVARLNTRDADFEQRFTQRLQWAEGDITAIERTVAEIIQRVRQEGDPAVIDLTHRFDRIRLTPETMACSEQDFDDARSRLDPTERAALEEAARRIRAYHMWQLPPLGVRAYWDETGAMLGQRLTPLHRVGLYVPGGLASYPSSVLMNAIPARVAGVKELIMVVPAPDGYINPLVLEAARIANVDHVFRIGGAQAVAALAYGTATVPSVDKIVGPGNIYVATAKRQVFGQVGIDMIAGPSEILIIADNQNDPRWIAIDLLSQAEHDVAAQSILITDDPAFADRVVAEIDTHMKTLERRPIIEQALRERGMIIVARDLDEACQLASRAAPEHLELAVADPFAMQEKIPNAGAFFLGRHTPEPIGDYVAGPNHVLPTGGTARFSSPLGVHDFIKRSSLIALTPDALRHMGPAAARLAASEGLTAHQRSVEIRLNETQP
jgi:histidinol dehydrogenase